MTLEHGWLHEAMVWSCCLGIYLLRLLTLGSNVNRKYRGCLSAILTEQINLHLAIEQRPESKEQLTVANNVLKLAADLLKVKSMLLSLILTSRTSFRYYCKFNLSQ